MEWDRRVAAHRPIRSFPFWWNLWHGAFGNQTAHVAHARSAPRAGKSGQASGKSARFPPRAFQQIVLSDVGHPADEASGSVDLWGRLPKPGHLLCVAGLCPPSPAPHRHCGAEFSSLHLPLGPHGPARRGFHSTEPASGKILSRISFPRGQNRGSQCQEALFRSVQVSTQITTDLNRSGMQAESQWCKKHALWDICFCLWWAGSPYKGQCLTK